MTSLKNFLAGIGILLLGIFILIGIPNIVLNAGFLHHHLWKYPFWNNQYSCGEMAKRAVEYETDVQEIYGLETTIEYDDAMARIEREGNQRDQSVRVSECIGKVVLTDYSGDKDIILYAERYSGGDIEAFYEIAAAPLSVDRPTPIAKLPPVATATPAVRPSPSPVPRALVKHLSEKLFMQDLINQERKKAGVPLVGLGDNVAAQLHAEDSLANCFSSHWDLTA